MAVNFGVHAPEMLFCVSAMLPDEHIAAAGATCYLTMYFLPLKM